jgi:hypothetical protein
VSGRRTFSAAAAFFFCNVPGSDIFVFLMERELNFGASPAGPAAVYHQTTHTVERINFTEMEEILRLACFADWDFTNAATLPGFMALPAGGTR